MFRPISYKTGAITPVCDQDSELTFQKLHSKEFLTKILCRIHDILVKDILVKDTLVKDTLVMDILVTDISVTGHFGN